MAQVIRVRTERVFIPAYGYALLGDVAVDRQEMHALVDTGISALYFTWKWWYEHYTHPGACATLITGCYQCPEGCYIGPTTPITYADGTRVDIFSNEGHLAFALGAVNSIQFGVVSGQNPGPDRHPPTSSIGLGLNVIPGYRSLMDQLQGKVASRTFAMYLRSSSSARTKGELLLGGGDPRVYVAPLHFVPLLSQQQFLVTIDTLQVSGRAKRSGINMPILVDTGVQGLIIPRNFATDFIRDISDQASEMARARVHIAWVPAQGIWVFDCSYISYFPMLLIGLGRGGSVLLTVAGKYYTRNIGGLCSLGMTLGDKWSLPEFMFIDRYVEFRPSQRRIGFANLV
ncbi:hypothetical protein FOL47_011005 [Perkinsus chesapeaki]|uniref:Peptidase A1 domain-containing protein n=1 Tax=Perkinsus chesapeaki TaxID=330153 RepID=A0A7J6KZ01_PERCH|nr:hypothetical protein FOL47_011005 [Perkinsus chesapeaki]